ncbi:hypothetical protein [Nostoc sp. CHAB 5715]|uniref:hypothetical protein n=1 Tax=Nostoc sp. CHAB 5715 TaxID=2780400 RepID=UPI001E527618|nr:hypothetical protein [Nostoc sp. CHAB 5715]MCC5621373.1 hypothetical protein [Nostoc sp. CHAB 5715]
MLQSNRVVSIPDSHGTTKLITGFFGNRAIAHWPRHAIALHPLRKWGSDRSPAKKLRSPLLYPLLYTLTC